MLRGLGAGNEGMIVAKMLEGGRELALGAHGQHTVGILRDSGFTDAQIASVLKSGVAVQAGDAATESGAEG